MFYAGALGWIAKDQWHPRKCQEYQGLTEEMVFDLKGINYKDSHFSTEHGILTMSLQHHLDKVKEAETKRDTDG